jgi:hypothetical protein
VIEVEAMSIVSRCPVCASALRVPDGLGNRAAQCPKCGEIFYPGRSPSSHSPQTTSALAPEAPQTSPQSSKPDDDVISDDFEVVDDSIQTDDDVESDDFEVIDDPVESESPPASAPKHRKRLLADDNEIAAALLGPRRKKEKNDERRADSDRPRRIRTDDEEDEPDPDRPRKKKGSRSRRRKEGKFNWTIIAIGAGVIITIGMITGMVFAVRSFFDDAISAERWKTFEAPGRFKVSMPGTPQQKSQTLGPVSMVLYLYEYDLSTGFFVGHSEGSLPAQRRALGAEGILDDSCDGALKGIEKDEPVEIRRVSINHGPYPGKLLVVNVKKRKVNMVARVFLVGERVYLLVAVGKKYDEENVNVKKFFDSFELLENPPPLQAVKK